MWREDGQMLSDKAGRVLGQLGMWKELVGRAGGWGDIF